MNREILRLAIPNILSNVSTPLIGSVDIFLVGGLSAAHIGAVGVGSMIFNLIYWNFGFLRMGTTGITAQAFGAGNDSKIIHTLGRAILIAMVLAGIVIAFQVPFSKGSFYFMNVVDNQYALVEEYFFIRIWAAPATLGLYVMLGWFFGMQNAIFPLILTVVINVANVIISYFLVKDLGWGIAGVAWGTVVAQYIGLTLAGILFLIKYSDFILKFRRSLLFRIEEFEHFIRINRDIFIRTVCMTFSFAFFYSQSSRGGETILAINVILMQFLNWMSYAVDGFAFAAESLVGKYKGAKDEKMTLKAIRYSFIWGMVMAVIFSLCYWIYGIELLQIFTRDEVVVMAASSYLFWMALFPIVGTPCYIWDGVFVGLTASKALRDSMFLALIIFLGAFHLLQNFMEFNHGLWLTLLLLLAARGIFQWVLFWRRGVDLD